MQADEAQHVPDGERRFGGGRDADRHRAGCKTPPTPKSSAIMPASPSPLASGVPAVSSEISSRAMTCELSFSSSASSSPSGVSWKSSPILRARFGRDAAAERRAAPASRRPTESPKSSDEPIGAEPLKSSGTSSSASPLSDGEMMLMPLLSPESVTSLPLRRAPGHRHRHRARARKGR